MSTQLAEGDGERRQKRSRVAPRPIFACTACRRRKIRCSGSFPSCNSCGIRREECVYEGIRAQSSAAVTEREVDATTSAVVERDIVLPSPELRRKAILYFRENYETTLLTFIPPQDLILDDTGQGLPTALLLSIITLASKFVPEFTPHGIDTSTNSHNFAKATQQALNRDYNKPVLSTIQACLILCIYEVGHGAEHEGWLRLGHAIRLAQLLQLHKLDSGEALFHWGPPSRTFISLTRLETERRTLWCAFCIERLLTNGRDRISTLRVEHITTRLPQPDEDFIYGRENRNFTLRHVVQNPEQVFVQGGLFSHFVRIVNILGDVLEWHGNGGRYLDNTCPWLDDMPFSNMDQALQHWRSMLPRHLDHSPSNIPLIIAAGHGKIWLRMFLLFYQARAYLHREYLPFTPVKGYDPSLGPCDGPPLTPPTCNVPVGWWHNSARVMIESADSISELYEMLDTRQLSATSYPFIGLCILTAASIHIQSTVHNWPSLQYLTENSRLYLQKDMEACHKIGLDWPVGMQWIHQLTLYYKLNILTKNSFGTSTPTSIDTATINVSEVKDGMMNYIREIPNNTKRIAHQKIIFDFESWIDILNNSAVQREKSPTKDPPDNEANLEPSPSPAPEVGNGIRFGAGWWDDWDVDSWDPSLFT